MTQEEIRHETAVYDGFERSKLEEAALIKSGPRRQIEGRAEINQSFVLQP